MIQFKVALIPGDGVGEAVVPDDVPVSAHFVRHPARYPVWRSRPATPCRPYRRRNVEANTYTIKRYTATATEGKQL